MRPGESLEVVGKLEVKALGSERHSAKERASLVVGLLGLGEAQEGLLEGFLILQPHLVSRIDDDIPERMEDLSCRRLSEFQQRMIERQRLSQRAVPSGEFLESLRQLGDLELALNRGAALEDLGRPYCEQVTFHIEVANFESREVMKIVPVIIEKHHCGE